MPAKIDISKSELQKLYIEQQKSTSQIAKILSCSKSCVLYKLKRFDIKIRPVNKLENLEGKKFDSLLVVERLADKNSKSTKWKCLCDCGSYTVAKAGHLKSRNHKSCGKCYKHHFLTDTYWNLVKHSARKRNLEFEIDKNYMYSLWTKQEGRCAISGIVLTPPPKDLIVQNRKARTASIDRIDNEIGYVKGNVQWVHKKINMMRGKCTLTEFISFCHLVSQYNKKSNE